MAPNGTPLTASVELVPAELTSGIATLIVPELLVALAEPKAELAVMLCEDPLQMVAADGVKLMAAGCGLMVSAIGVAVRIQPVTPSVTTTL